MQYQKFAVILYVTCNMHVGCKNQMVTSECRRDCGIDVENVVNYRTRAKCHRKILLQGTEGLTDRPTFIL